MDNFFAAEALLIARLQQQLPAVPRNYIRKAINLEWAVTNALAPSVSVIFYDDDPDTAAGGTGRRGRSQLSNQYWLILLSVRNVSDVGTAAQQDAGRLIQTLLQALQGYVLSSEHLPLYRQKCPYRKTDKKDGIVHFPFLFSTGITITGSGNGR